MQSANVAERISDPHACSKSSLAVVIGPPSYRKRQEVEIFLNCLHFETTLVLSSFEEPWRIDGVNYAYVDMETILPDFLSTLLVRKPYSPVSFVRLSSPENCLEDAAVINCIELYSFISRQCAEIAERNDKKLVVSVFETLPSPPLHAVPPFSLNVEKVLEQADAFIAYTKRSMDYLRQLLVADDKIKLIYPGVDLQRFCMSDERNHEEIRILFVGGFAGEKGLTLLMKAFIRLCVEGLPVELWICTAPRNRREEALIVNYAQKYSIKALGYVAHHEMPSIYKQCDIFCLPSFDKRKFGFRVWEEQFGFALIEAMASALPVVATRCGAIPEVVGDENQLVPQHSVKSLYTALRTLVEDEKYRLRLARANRERAERLFDIEKQRTLLDQTVSELL